MIVRSILDNDQYKFSMQQAVLELFSNTSVEYRFKNRGKQKFTPIFLQLLKQEIQNMSTLALSDQEYLWLKNNITYFKPQYIEFLKNYRFNPAEIECSLDKDNNLEISIKGLWRTTILWEVPLMALISELYFTVVDKNWKFDDTEVRYKAISKFKKLNNNNCKFTDFGTRRRRSFATQDEVVCCFSNLEKCNKKGNFIGTSNVYLAMIYGVKAIGTVAHEFIQAMQALESFNHCNYYAMQNWIKVYNTDLGTYLPDTITTDMFLQNFNRRFAMLFSSLRHDSGCPFEFTEKIIRKYKELNIDPMSKFIVFSDGLDVDKALEIAKYCEGKIKYSFGIGTNFSNDFENSLPLNMVIKLWKVNGFPVVKLSDVNGKANGEEEAVNIMKWMIKNQTI